MADIKLQPQNLDAEKAVIGAVLLDKDAIIKIAEFLQADHFYDEKHKHIFEAVMELYDDREPIDIVTVPDKLKRKNLLKAIGGVAYITELLNQTPSASNVESYGRLIRDAYIRRKLIQVSAELGDLGFNEEDPVDNLLDTAEQKLFAISESSIRGEFIPLRKALEINFELLDGLYRNKGQLRGVPTGFKTIDTKLNGFRPSNLIILAARPSVGKSALLLNMAQHAAVQHNIPIAIFSLEMSVDELVTRMVAAQSNIDSFKITSGQLTDDELASYGEAQGVLADAPIYIDDTPSISIMELRTKSRRLHMEKGIQMIIVDYLQLMRGRNVENRVQEVSEISWGLKALARELKIPVLAAAQLNRSVEQRGAKVPQLSDLRESGCLAGDSLVYLPDSGTYSKIKDLVGKSGFNVLSLNTDSWKLEKSLVSKAFSTGKKEIYTLVTKLGREIKATGNHKFLTINGWKRLDELSNEDYLAMPRQLNGANINTVTVDSLALLGHLIGDGCTLPRHAIQYTTREIDLAQTVIDLANKVFGDLLNLRIKAERSWYQVYLSSKIKLARGKRNPVSIWLEEMGIFVLRSREKFVPKIVFRQPKESIAIFLRHLWSTDGCIRMRNGRKPYPSVYYSTSSMLLANNIQSLLLRFEINARVKKVLQGNKGRDQYHVVLSGRDEVLRFISEIGSVGNYKTESANEIVEVIQSKYSNTNHDVIPSNAWRSLGVPAMQELDMTSRQMQSALGMSYAGTSLYKNNIGRIRLNKVASVVKSDVLSNLSESDIYWDQISSIELSGKEDVYDLTVPQNHNFVANNIVVHNSIEQDADVVMFLYRPDEENRSEVNLAIAKHRNGPTAMIPMYFRGERTRFYEQSAKEGGAD